MKPKRVQRKRTKGFRLPENTICVNRGTKWGNPFKIGALVDLDWFPIFDSIDTLHYITRSYEVKTAEEAVYLFKKYCVPRLEGINELSGKHLACFCSLDEKCHADVLLEIANR